MILRSKDVCKCYKMNMQIIDIDLYLFSPFLALDIPKTFYVTKQSIADLWDKVKNSLCKIDCILKHDTKCKKEDNYNDNHFWNVAQRHLLYRCCGLENGNRKPNHKSAGKHGSRQNNYGR